ncbi:MAG: CRISPR-associated helicase Cas3' [Syntrophorhabdaceae bacterium]|nr:CRISPR-associated helicase Cas3' [Syntrophorhabdaceae bacterium]
MNNPLNQEGTQFYGRILLKDKTKRQPLKSHLTNVAKKALQFAEEALRIRLSDSDEVKQWKEVFHNTAWRAGLLHDLGKYRKEFQEYLFGLRNRSQETNHSVYGSAAACHHFNDDASAFAIAGHHAGLHDIGDLDSMVNGTKYDACQKYTQLLTLAQNEKELGIIQEFYPTLIDDTDENEKRRYEFMTRVLFSIIVDSDRLDAEQWEMEQKTGKVWQRSTVELNAESLLQKIQEVREGKKQGRPNDVLNHLRNTIFDSCIEKGGSLSQGFFSLTVPTGGGKTLSSMAFALSHAKKHDLRRVIVVIPYLSIIEQNAKEYRDALGAELVLEHHSAVELSQNSHDVDNNCPDEPTNVSDMEKVMENWDVPVIVTTSVQFIETLFAASSGQARKLHNIARSIVIFDEVQSLPAHLLEPTLNVLRELTDRWGVSVLFCSATQPAFKKSAALKNGFEPDEMTPIISSPENVFKKLRRVDYRIEPKDNPLDWRTIAERMIAQSQALCVLNVRRQAFQLWEALRRLMHEKGFGKEGEEALFHLSSAMCPAHRLDLLGLSENPPPNNIKERLRSGKHCWVASTQLIEAGVDIDFPIVFRAIGPLDSIVQAAGRCNREGLLCDEQGNLCRGQVIVFYPADGGLPPGIYSKGTSITSSYLEPDKLAEDPLIFTQYFHELHQITPTDFDQRGQRTIQEDRAQFRFRKVAEHARVIKKGETISVIVPYGNGKAMIDEIRRTKDFDFKTMRRLQRYMVNVRKQEPISDFAKLNRLGAITQLLPNRLEIPVVGDWCYKIDPPLGVVIENRPLEDFFS